MSGYLRRIVDRGRPERPAGRQTATPAPRRPGTVDTDDPFESTAHDAESTPASPAAPVDRVAGPQITPAAPVSPVAVPTSAPVGLRGRPRDADPFATPAPPAPAVTEIAAGLVPAVAAPVAVEPLGATPSAGPGEPAPGVPLVAAAPAADGQSVSVNVYPPPSPQPPAALVPQPRVPEVFTRLEPQCAPASEPPPAPSVVQAAPVWLAPPPAPRPGPVGPTHDVVIGSVVVEVVPPPVAAPLAPSTPRRPAGVVSASTTRGIARRFGLGQR